MIRDRRTFLKRAGAAGVLATITTTPAVPDAAAAPDRTLGRGMPRGLTLLTIRRQGRDGLGVKTDRGILDVRQAASRLQMYAPTALDDLLQNEDGPSLEALVRAAQNSPRAPGAFIKEEGIEYGPLVSRPEKILCVGLNYRKHAEEIGSPIPKAPVLFNKFNGSLNRHMGTIKLPVDLANTSDMIYNTRQIISYSSRYFALKPGDIIFTGTPEGVIRGMPKEKQMWLKPGDTIACSVEKLGELKFDLV